MEQLYHHGIKGQKWGVRRFQNEDGTLTDEGIKRYGRNIGKVGNKQLRDQISTYENSDKSRSEKANTSKVYKKYQTELKGTDEYKKAMAYQKYMEDTYREFYKEHPNGKLLLPKDFINEYNDSMSKADSKSAEISKKYISEYSEATLKDLGYEVTAKGKKRVSKILSDLGY